MVFGKNKKIKDDIPPYDSTSWLIDSSFAEFLLLHSIEIKYMAMFGYTFLHGMF